jgi:Ham1 family
MKAEPDFSRCVFASSNRGKLREVEAILGPLGLTIVAQSELGIDSAAETAVTFAGNALLKARHAARRSGLPAIGLVSCRPVTPGSMRAILTTSANCSLNFAPFQLGKGRPGFIVPPFW